MKTAYVLLLLLATVAGSAAEELKPFDFNPGNGPGETLGQAQTCGFSELKLPPEYLVLAAGAYSGRKIEFQIDQSGHEGTQIDVAVNSPNKPVVLMLGAYEPTIWNIGWSKGTKVLAVYASGYHRQVIAGLSNKVPVLISTYENRGPCGYFYVGSDKQLAALNPQARRVFGRPVDMVYPAKNGKVVVGEPLQASTQLVTSTATTPEMYHDKDAPKAGPAGLEEAVQQGLLRKATAADAEAWSDALAQNSPNRDIPPIAGQGIPKPPKPHLHNGYVVLKPFTYPAGLYGANSATFLIPKGVPRPTGKPGHSAIYDFNNLQCQGPLCNAQ